ncbi:unnamed protein product, partial [Rotaria magnacalcarata]
SHLPENEKIEVREVREKLKQRAINETTPIPRIYDEECAKAMLSTTAIAILPSEREMNSGINKARRAIAPIIPTTQLFDIPESYSKTLNKNEFLITDKTVTRCQRILLFSTTSPCVFGLLPNRQKNTYHFMFQELKAIAVQMKMNFSPKLIMSDFEVGLLSVVALEFVTTTSLSCYFHFTQAIYRANQRVGLSTAYNNDDDIKKYCRQLMALPLIPEAIIEDTYDKLIATIPSTLKETLKDLLQYFQ